MTLRSRLKDGVLRLEMPIQKPRPSGSGKTLVVATTHGLVNTGISYHGSEIIVNANAFIGNKTEDRNIQKHKKRTGIAMSAERGGSEKQERRRK